MNAIMCLAAILCVLMILIGGTKGFRSFISLFLNFGVFLFTVIFMATPSLNPIILTLIGCTLISCINLFFINSVNSKTTIAFISTMITIIILVFFINIVTENAMIHGFGEEEVDELSIFSLYIGVDFVKIAASVIIMSTIGAITDISISITSPINEIFHHHPMISRKDLFLSGLGIGKDILGTTTNTLFFAFVGGYMGLLLWFKDLSYSVGKIVNSKVFSAEMITILCAGIGVALVIPISSWINAYYLVKSRKKGASPPPL